MHMLGTSPQPEGITNPPIAPTPASAAEPAGARPRGSGVCEEGGSEFVRITHTVHSRQTWLKYVPEIANGNKTFAGTPCTVQLLGSDADNMAVNALEAVRLGGGGTRGDPAGR